MDDTDGATKPARRPARIWRTLWRLGLGCALMGVLLGISVLLYLVPALPSVGQLRHVELQIPLRIYSADGALIGEFGAQRRKPIAYEDIPGHFVNAILAAEDDNFFNHPGVDIMGLARAAGEIVATGSIQSGGSTITMQVARNFFLSIEQTFLRKLNEILLALYIEQRLSKEEILTLYVNKIYLGKRAYGISAAANIYYGMELDQLNLPQLAMIAGIPKAPSLFNPVTNPERALARRNWILQRMANLGDISDAEMQAALVAPMSSADRGPVLDHDAIYPAELARQEVLSGYGREVYEAGIEVHTTIDMRQQRAAERALRRGLLEYDRRHGYRGPERRLPPDDGRSPQAQQEFWQGQLAATPVVGGLAPAIVVSVDDSGLMLLLASGEITPLRDLGDMRIYRNESSSVLLRNPAEAFSIGDLIRLESLEDADGVRSWRIAQVPRAQSAIVSLSSRDGAVRALVGGFDFYRSNYNRAVQAARQPGSSLKPLLYAIAFENGFTPASIINDAPIVFDDPLLEEAWRPENDSGVFYGPTRLRRAIYKSRNLVSIRVLRSLGVPVARRGLTRFGIPRDADSDNLTLALGSQALTPMAMAAGYAIFANGGFRISPHIISSINDRDGNIIYKADPPVACPECPRREDRALVGPHLQPDHGEGLPTNRAPRVLDERIAWTIDSILKDVITRGTGVRAKVLGRGDIAGKTGTTNGPRDAWFTGYHPDLVAATWLGFDDNSLLGRSEFGGAAALPVWIEFMREALAGLPEKHLQRPEGLVSVRIDPSTGERAQPDDPSAIFEVFLQEHAPKPLPQTQSRRDKGDILDDIF